MVQIQHPHTDRVTVYTKPLTPDNSLHSVFSWWSKNVESYQKNKRNVHLHPRHIDATPIQWVSRTKVTAGGSEACQSGDSLWGSTALQHTHTHTHTHTKKDRQRERGVRFQVRFPSPFNPFRLIII